MLKYVVSIVVLFSFGTVFAQNQFAPSVNDARARAMGNTVVTSATGSSAMFYNPANLSLLEGITIEFGGRVLSGEVYHRYRDNPYLNYDPHYTNHFKFTNISIAVPLEFWDFGEDFILGIGYNSFLDFSYNFSSTMDHGSDWHPSREKITQRGGLYTISPSVAYRFNDIISVGFTFNESTNTLITKDKESAFDEPPIGSPSHYNYIEKYRVSATMYAAGLNIRPHNKINIGFVWKPGFTFKYSDELKPDYHSFAYGEWFIPPSWSLGMNLDILSPFSVALEYNRRRFDFGPDHYVKPLNDCYRIGLEYRSLVDFRVGYFKDTFCDFGPYDVLPGESEGLTFGIGYSFMNILFDVFGEISTHKIYKIMYYDLGNFGAVNNAEKEDHFVLGMSTTLTIF
ncbi:MAG: hypothetical protein GY855_02225 [candidate division Zixibacteria bacterium]|nr:hypothetical protein [candidate division Zixibacteria bacterium]